MNYDVKVVKRKDYIPTYWSGGVATELITYPIYSNFSSKNFLWRLGVAKIDILESTFSNLSNVFRHLMVIQGKMNIHHKDRYVKTLSSFQQDTFMGDWSTKTYGKCSVFNLMTRENYDGKLIYLNIKSKGKVKLTYSIPDNKEIVAICFYPVCGNFKSHINNKIFKVKNNELLYIDYLLPNTLINFILYNTSRENSKIVASIIYKNLF